jgi:hypothetical protein
MWPIIRSFGAQSLPGDSLLLIPAPLPACTHARPAAPGHLPPSGAGLGFHRTLMWRSQMGGLPPSPHDPGTAVPYRRIGCVFAPVYRADVEEPQRHHPQHSQRHRLPGADCYQEHPAPGVRLVQAHRCGQVGRPARGWVGYRYCDKSVAVTEADAETDPALAATTSVVAAAFVWVKYKPRHWAGGLVGAWRGRRVCRRALGTRAGKEMTGMRTGANPDGAGFSVRLGRHRHVARVGFDSSRPAAPAPAPGAGTPSATSTRQPTFWWTVRASWRSRSHPPPAARPRSLRCTSTRYVRHCVRRVGG